MFVRIGSVTIICLLAGDVLARLPRARRPLLPPVGRWQKWRRRSRPIRVTIPTPGELFAALGKPAKPDWAGHYRTPIPMTYKNRAQIALNIGGLIADGFIAVEAQDTQQVKNIGTDIVKLAKALGVSENILAAATASTNSLRTANGTRSRRNSRRRRTK